MLNHARTLLLNRNGTDAAYTPGEQAVPVDYAALELPTYLQTLRARLFGADPDRAMLNYRLHQYMTLLHATELDADVRAFDSRISYLDGTGAGVLFLPATFAPQQTGDGLLVFGGEPAAPDAAGRLWHDFTLTRVGGSLQVDQYAPRAATAVTAVVDVDGLSAPIALGSSGYSVMIPATSLGPWQVGLYNRPQWTLGAIMESLRVAGEPVLLELFGADPAEPMRSYREMFLTHPEIAYALGGLLMAAIRRTDEVYRG